MSTDRDAERHAAARLLEAMAAPDELACAAAEDLIHELVEAEQAGADVDSDPRFTALLAHLDHCPDCLDLYARTSAALEALDELHPAPAPERLLAPVRRGAYAALRVLGGLRQRLEVALTIPALVPIAAGDPVGIDLFDQALPEIGSAPQLRITLLQSVDGPVLRVTLQAVEAQRWRVRLTIDAQQYMADVGPDGVAELRGFSEDQLRSAQATDLLIAEAADFE